MAPRPPLLAHQTGDVEWIRRVQRGLLGNEPGLGKSRSVIEAFDGGNNLVIAPSMVLDSGTWQEQIQLWSDHPDRWTVAPYSLLNRRTRTAKGGTSPTRAPRPEYAGPWDAVVLDEAHYVKGRSTTWSVAARKIAGRAGAVVPMTGTPIPNWAHELFVLLQLIYPQEAKPGGRFGSFWRWAQRWFDCSPTKYSRGMPVAGPMLACDETCEQRPSTDPCAHYRHFTEVNLGDRFRRMLRDDCLDLPPITTQQVKVPLSTAARAMYRDLKKQFLATLDDGQEVVAWSSGALNVLLDKITTSPWVALASQQDPATLGKVGGGKLEVLRQDLLSRSRPTLVLAHYRDSVWAARQVARDEGMNAGMIRGDTPGPERTKLVQQFQAGKLDVLVGSLETLAEGVTLTRADMAIFVESSFKPFRNEQARYRVHRVGQTRPVTIREYLTPGTVDERKRQLLETKTDQQMRVLTAAQFAALL